MNVKNMQKYLHMGEISLLIQIIHWNNFPAFINLHLAYINERNIILLKNVFKARDRAQSERENARLYGSREDSTADALVCVDARNGILDEDEVE